MIRQVARRDAQDASSCAWRSSGAGNAHPDGQRRSGQPSMRAIPTSFLSMISLRPAAACHVRVLLPRSAVEQCLPGIDTMLPQWPLKARASRRRHLRCSPDPSEAEPHLWPANQKHHPNLQPSLDLSRFRGRLSVWVACCRRMAIRSAVVDMMDPFAAWGPSEGEETAHGAAARGRCLVASLQNRVYGPGAAGKVSQHPPNRRCVRLTRLTHAVARSSWVSVDPAQNGAGADCTSLR